MSKDLLVTIKVHDMDEPYHWCIDLESPIPMKDGSGTDREICVGSGYKTRASAIKAAKRLLPLPEISIVIESVTIFPS